MTEMKGNSDPFGDVDVIVSVPDDLGLDPAKVTAEVAAGLGGGGADGIRRSGRTKSFLTKERYQVDLLFCPRDRLDFIAALKSNNDFLAFFGHILRCCV